VTSEKNTKNRPVKLKTSAAVAIAVAVVVAQLKVMQLTPTKFRQWEKLVPSPS